MCKGCIDWASSTHDIPCLEENSAIKTGTGHYGYNTCHADARSCTMLHYAHPTSLPPIPGEMVVSTQQSDRRKHAPPMLLSAQQQTVKGFSPHSSYPQRLPIPHSPHRTQDFHLPAYRHKLKMSNALSRNLCTIPRKSLKALRYKNYACPKLTRPIARHSCSP